MALICVGSRTEHEQNADTHGAMEREFTAMHRENACIVLTRHAFISGRASRVVLIEDLVRYTRRQSGIWFTTHEADDSPPSR